MQYDSCPACGQHPLFAGMPRADGTVCPACDGDSPAEAGPPSSAEYLSWLIVAVLVAIMLSSILLTE